MHSEEHFAQPPRLFIGPWVGEFGIEIIRWVPFARRVARSRPWCEIIVAARPSSSYLYSDFATTFVPFLPSSSNSLGFSCPKNNRVPLDLVSKYIDTKNGDVLLSPTAFHTAQTQVGLTANLAEFHNFSTNQPPPEKPFHLLVHARATTKAKQDFKNWSLDNWQALIDALSGNFRIASIGARDGAHKLKGTEDLRGIDLSELSRYCKQATCVVGPSSGPVHFALHCGTPVITWMGNHHLNYDLAWNPFQVPLCRIMSWQPTPEVVLAKVRNMLNLVSFQDSPIRFCVFGTKRSGHHAVMEWIASQFPEVSFAHFNDCVTTKLLTPPSAPYVLPLDKSLPKQINENSNPPFVRIYNRGRDASQRMLTFEGAPIYLVPSIPEVHQSKTLIFVLRDSANFVASLKHGIRHYRNSKFNDEPFKDALRTYDSYLAEALGNTNFLGNLGQKVIFVSYNKWHHSDAYRTELARLLGSKESGTHRLGVSKFGSGSSFQSIRTSSNGLDTLNRWKHFADKIEYWNLIADHNRTKHELAFHGELTHINPLMERFGLKSPLQNPTETT